MAKLNKQFFGMENTKEAIRINKFLSDAGICSRREADRQVEAGKVQIEGEAAKPGSRVLPGQRVTYCGREVEAEKRLTLLAFYKPKGIVCTADPNEPDNIVDYLNYESRIYPIGRLDKDSEGLILLTNHGYLVNKILRGSNGHEKEYLVTVNKPLTMDFLHGMAGGVPILDTVTRPCVVEALDKTSFRIILTQGLNRQIRRMCEYFGYRVLELKRIRIMNISLGRLKPGTYRNLTEWELEELKLCLEDSEDVSAWEKEQEEQNAGQEELLDIREQSKQLEEKNERVITGQSKQSVGKFNSYKKPSAEKTNSYKKPLAEKRSSYGKPLAEKRSSYGKPSAEKTSSYKKPSAEKRSSYGKPSAEKTNSYGKRPDKPKSWKNEGQGRRRESGSPKKPVGSVQMRQQGSFRKTNKVKKSGRHL